MTTKYNDHQHFQLNAICMKPLVVATSVIRTKHVSVISCDETTLYMPVLLVQVPSFVTYNKVFHKNDSRAQNNKLMHY